jgi:8-oxo-dGTP diphosphatase
MGDERRAAGVVIFRGPAASAEVLVLRNARQGHLGFAKGVLEHGEGELAGALREVREETGLAPRLDPAFIETIRYVIPAGKHEGERKEVVYFLGDVEASAPVVLSPEHDRAEWLPVAQAVARLEHETLRDVLRRADRFRRARAGVATTG